jgi:serine/threonine-protein kinase
MGTTYLAWDSQWQERQNRPNYSAAAVVVLKEMNADLAQIRKAQELFEREARTLKCLDHPGVPKFFDFFCGGG